MYHMSTKDSARRPGASPTNDATLCATATETIEMKMVKKIHIGPLENRALFLPFNENIDIHRLWWEKIQLDSHF